MEKSPPYYVLSLPLVQQIFFMLGFIKISEKNNDEASLWEVEFYFRFEKNIVFCAEQSHLLDRPDCDGCNGEFIWISQCDGHKPDWDQIVVDGLVLWLDNFNLYQTLNSCINEHSTEILIQLFRVQLRALNTINSRIKCVIVESK